MESELFYIFLGFLAAFTFGITGVLLKVGMEAQDALFGLLVRSIGSLPFLIGLSLYYYGFEGLEFILIPKTMILIFITSSILVLGDFVFMSTLKKRPIGTIVPIVSISPLFVAILLVITGTESISTLIFLLTIMIIFGIMLITYQHSELEKETTSFDRYSIGVGIFIASLWGVMTFLDIIILRIDGTSGLTFSMFKIGFLTIISAILLMISTTSRRSFSVNLQKRKSVATLLIAGFVGWTVGLVLSLTSFQQGPVDILNPIIGMNPLFAVILSLGLGMEKITRLKGAGILICVLSSAFISL